MASSDVQDYLLCVETDKEQASSIAKRTSKKLQELDTTLLEVVQSLGEYINDEDSRIRGRAVSYLTAVLSPLPSKFLSRQQVDVLCQFFSDRIEDIGAIEGLARLQSLERFTSEMAQTVVRTVFAHFPDFRSRPQSSRHQILQLLNELMSNHRQALHRMEAESLVGITELVSGEKDPRNLMLVFSMCRVLMLEWDISNHAEILFDSVYAYFPITFRPPPNDPYGITAQDLKDRLQDCISSTEKLAPYAIPNLLDKLDSTSPVVKKDVLRTLLACAKTYNASTMSLYSITLWDSLKFEILNAQEPELADETLLVLRAIAACLAGSTQTSPTASPLAQYIRAITKECIEHLQAPAQRQAKASGDILKSVSSANSEAFVLVAKSVMAPTITIFQATSEIANRRALLEVLGQLFDSAIEVLGTWMSNETAAKSENPLLAFSEQLLEIFSQALMGTVKEEVSFRVAAARGLQRLTLIRDLLQENEIGMIVQHLNELVLRTESYGRDDLKSSAMEGLAAISKYKPRLIMDITFPAFMAQLPDTDAEADARADYHTTLEGLAEISVEREVFDTLVRRLLNKLDVLLNTQNIHSPKYTSALLSTLLFAMERKGLADDPNLQNYCDRVVVGLISRATAAAVKNENLTALNDVSVLEVLGRLSNLIVRNATLEKKALVCDNVYDLFSLQSGLEELCRATNGSMLERIWILSTWLLASIPRHLQSPLLQSSNISATISKLLAVLNVEEVGTVQFLAITGQTGLYINKHLPSSALEIASNHLSTIYNHLSSNNDQELGKQPDQIARSTLRAVGIIFSISKALTLRIAPDTDKILGDLMSLLDASKYPLPINKAAAASFSGLLAADPVLSKSNGAQIRLLAPQRVFQTLTPMISTAFKSSSQSEEKENCLTALSGIIGSVPPNIVVPELPTLLPLLLRSLDLSDQSVKLATLETLAMVIARAPSALEDSGHVPSLVRRLLKAAAAVSMARGVVVVAAGTERAAADTPKVRQMAVRCLFLMPSHVKGSGSRTNPLLSLKKDVVLGLMKVLDDPKRDVRKEAVDARAAWLRGVDDVEDDSD